MMWRRLMASTGGRFFAACTDGGQNALLAKPIPGRPKKVSPEQMQWIAGAVIDETPLQHRFEYGLWTPSLISELIHRQSVLYLQAVAHRSAIVRWPETSGLLPGALLTMT